MKNAMRDISAKYRNNTRETAQQKTKDIGDELT